jgi:predicted TIM-barrel fold metal-dependent hydrolase
VGNGVGEINMIIDSHVHIGKTEKTERFWSFNKYVEYMDKHDIDLTIAMPNVSNILSFPDLNHIFLSEYYNIDFRIKSRFKLLLLIDVDDASVRKQADMYSGFICGLKYHPSISRVNVDDVRFYRWVDVALERGWPILIHCGRDPISHIKYLVDMAKRMPRVNFIAAHMGGNSTDLIEEAIKLIKSRRVENIYLDTSNGKLPWLIEKAVNVLGKDRILFGSDEPYADVRVAKYLIELTNISTDAKECIFCKNVENLFRR